MNLYFKLHIKIDKIINYAINKCINYDDFIK